MAPAPNEFQTRTLEFPHFLRHHMPTEPWQAPLGLVHAILCTCCHRKEPQCTSCLKYIQASQVKTRQSAPSLKGSCALDLPPLDDCPRHHMEGFDFAVALDAVEVRFVRSHCIVFLLHALSSTVALSTVSFTECSTKKANISDQDSRASL